MKTRQIKTLCVAAAIAIAQFGARDIYQFLHAGSATTSSSVREKVSLALGAVHVRLPVRPLLVGYADVRRGYQELNWTGQLPQVVTPPLPPLAQEPPAVSALINVLMVRVDTDDPRASLASISYRALAKFPPRMADAGQDLCAGDRLLAPHDWAKVARITLDGIEFEFDDDRKAEVVPAAFETGSSMSVIHISGPERATPAQAIRGQGETVELRANTFRVGRQDRKQLTTQYPEILSHDIRHRRHFNTATRQYDGIEVQSVVPGSFAERHGASAGDIIRSINGHPVSSVAEAVAFVRHHEQDRPTWEIEVENQGKTRTVTYELPAND